jgi:ABC-type phosphate transport system substrate-binding protein
MDPRRARILLGFMGVFCMSKAGRIMLVMAALALGAFDLSQPCLAQGTSEQPQAAAPQNSQSDGSSAQQPAANPLPVLKVKTRMVVKKI